MSATRPAGVLWKSTIRLALPRAPASKTQTASSKSSCECQSAPTSAAWRARFDAARSPIVWLCVSAYGLALAEAVRQTRLGVDPWASFVVSASTAALLLVTGWRVSASGAGLLHLPRFGASILLAPAV